jgi:hypothetical protein
VKRSILLALVAALTLALGAGTATAAVDGGAQTAAKKKAGKKKAAKCKTAKKKAKGKARARKSLAAADSAAKKGKAKGKKKAKRKCGKAKAKPKAKPSPRQRVRSPQDQRIVDRYRDKREQMEERLRNRTKAPTVQDVAPLDGTYTSVSAPGLTVTVSGNSTQARVTYTLAKTAFYGEVCQTKDVAIDVSGALSVSQTGKAHLSADVNAPNGDRQSANGYLGKDGSFELGISASYEEPPGKGSFCSGNTQLSGLLSK